MLKIMVESAASDLPDHTTHLRLYFKMQISSLHLGPGKSLSHRNGLGIHNDQAPLVQGYSERVQAALASRGSFVKPVEAQALPQTCCIRITRMWLHKPNW